MGPGSKSPGPIIARAYLNGLKEQSGGADGLLEPSKEAAGSGEAPLEERHAV